MTEIRDNICSFDNLYKGMTKSRKGVMWKDSVARYSNNALTSILKLKDSLLDDSYEINLYCKFTIHEPKTREIVSTKFKDRVFQRSLCDNYVYDALTSDFIYDNGACQIGKGTDFARNRLICHLERHYRRYGNSGYVLNIDFKGYFGNTPHKTAIDAVSKRIPDEWAREHVIRIIKSYNEEDNPGMGLGLGSQVTQLIQLAVLSDLDHFIKEKLKIKAYIRYMDDLILIHPSKEYLIYCLEEIREYIENLGLILNKKKTQINKLSQRIKFLGFDYSLTSNGKVIMVVTKDNIKKRKRKLRKHKKLVIEGRMTKEKADECFESWKAHAKKGNSYGVMKMMNEFYDKLWEGWQGV